VVYVVGKDGVIAQKLVETGPLVDGLRVIRHGVSADDTIVIDGVQRARPGKKVKATPGKVVAPSPGASPTADPLEVAPSRSATTADKAR